MNIMIIDLYHFSCQTGTGMLHRNTNCLWLKRVAILMGNFLFHFKCHFIYCIPYPFIHIYCNRKSHILIIHTPMIYTPLKLSKLSIIYFIPPSFLQAYHISYVTCHTLFDAITEYKNKKQRNHFI